MSARVLSLMALMLCLSACTFNPYREWEFRQLVARAEQGDPQAMADVAATYDRACRGQCAFGPWLPACDEAARDDWAQRVSNTAPTAAAGTSPMPRN